MYATPKVTTSNRGALVTGRYTERMALAQRHWLQGVLKRVRDDVRALAPVDLGTFKKSVIYRTSRKGLVVDGNVYSTAPEGQVSVIEFGRRENRKMPPSGALLGWMQRHGWDPKKEFVLRRAIGRDGIPAVAPFSKAFEKNRALLATQQRYLASALITELNR